ncbi:hypothetical protein Bca52824_036956 [Brassica carinata]|uniref:Uncharacterized protein n=1 Tax=Brassica carinata TaxID=52824 RepID=A0A8X7S4W4_BRACI|nr:hypothetical protein Bca52824_036956 [Brassica carinata]
MQRGKTCQQGRKVMDCELGLANRAAYYISERVEKVMRDNKCTNGDLFVFKRGWRRTTTPFLCVCQERKKS